MKLVRWNPWEELNTIQRQFDGLFDEQIAPTMQPDFIKVPAVEIQETEDAVHLKLEIPGIDAKDLDIQVTENMISIRGERKSHKSEENGVTKSEFCYGKFQRIIPLKTRIQNTDVKAEYKDGILNLTLPKKEEEKNKVIKVSLDNAA